MFKTSNKKVVADMPHLDKLHVVPMKTIGFRACMRDVPFRKQGRLKIEAPGGTDNYAGYWFDKKDKRQKKEGEKKHDDHEYYYYLHPDYHDD